MVALTALLSTVSGGQLRQLLLGVLQLVAVGYIGGDSCFSACCPVGQWLVADLQCAGTVKQ